MKTVIAMVIMAVTLVIGIIVIKLSEKRTKKKFSLSKQLETARKERRPKSKLECVRKDKCPDCKVKGKILVGPRGGMSVNVRCCNCGSRFNITPFGVERI